MITNIFAASFEQSLQLVKKPTLKSGKKKIGDMASPRFFKRFSTVLIFRNNYTTNFGSPFNYFFNPDSETRVS